MNRGEGNLAPFGGEMEQRKPGRPKKVSEPTEETSESKGVDVVVVRKCFYGDPQNPTMYVAGDELTVDRETAIKWQAAGVVKVKI